MAEIGSIIPLECDGSPREIYVRGHFVTPEEQQHVISIVADYLQEEFEWRYDDYQVPRLSVGPCLYARWVFDGSDSEYGTPLFAFRTYTEKQRGAFAITAVYDQDQLDQEERQRLDIEEWEVRAHAFLMTWFPEITDLSLDGYNKRAVFRLPEMEQQISWHDSGEDSIWIANMDCAKWKAHYSSRKQPKHLMEDYTMSNQDAAKWTVDRLHALAAEAGITPDTAWFLDDANTIVAYDPADKRRDKTKDAVIVAFDSDQHEPKEGHVKLLAAAPQLVALALRLLRNREPK